MEQIFEYEIKIDFVKNEKTKTVYCHNLLIKTEKEIAYKNIKYNKICVLNIEKDKSDKYPSHASLGDYSGSHFHVGDFIDEYSATVYFTQKPKSEKVVFNKLIKTLMARIYKDHGRYMGVCVDDLDGIKIQIKQ